MTPLKRRVLDVLRVRERPDPPPAAGPTLDVFRASRRYLALRRVEWVLTQAGALVGILFSLVLFGAIDLPFVQFGGLAEWVSNLDIQTPVMSLAGTDLVFLLEFFAITAYLSQFVGSGLVLTLNWEMRWYMVSDESLRIREGLVRVREQTMTVANI